MFNDDQKEDSDYDEELFENDNDEDDAQAARQLQEKLKAAREFEQILYARKGTSSKVAANFFTGIGIRLGRVCHTSYTSVAVAVAAAACMLYLAYPDGL